MAHGVWTSYAQGREYMAIYSIHCANLQVTMDTSRENSIETEHCKLLIGRFSFVIQFKYII